MRAPAKAAAARRLRRIEGQIGGIRRMVEDDRYCVDIFTRIDAVRAALHRVEQQVSRDHIAHCVADAFASGDPEQQREKVEELISAIGRMIYPDHSEIRVSFWFRARRHANPGRVYPDFHETRV